uniref:DUF725 domain-containing protein n=1 Tax=Strongyloides venezuelensis TaxID=75913 RepID=A0A0K0FST8_STRVS
MNNFFRLLTLLNTLDRASTCDPSSYNVVTSCYESFFNHYNFSTVETMTFPNYMDFVDARGQLEFASPHDNFIKDCTVQSRLTSCLGTAVACVNSTDLLKIFKFHKHDNQEYTGDYYMNTYKCTTAYSYITSNFNCLTIADHLSKDAITKCFSDMLTSPENELCNAALW